MSARIAAECDAIKAMLLEKNAAYGNSALDPVRIFSQANTIEQIRVRIDDKLSRLARGRVFGDEDTILDLIGYLVLLRVAVRVVAPSIGEEPCEAKDNPTQVPTALAPTVVDPAPLRGKGGEQAPPVKGRTYATDQGTGFRKAPFSHKPLHEQQSDAWQKAGQGVRGRCHGLTFTVWNARSGYRGKSTRGHVLAWYRGEPCEEHEHDCEHCGAVVASSTRVVQFHHPECPFVATVLGTNGAKRVRSEDAAQSSKSIKRG